MILGPHILSKVPPPFLATGLVVVVMRISMAMIVSSIADIIHFRQNVGLLKPILAILSRIYALFSVLFADLNNAVAYQKIQISS